MSFAQATLDDSIAFVRPNVLIGVSAQGGSFTTEIIKQMSAISERPVIFALSNPTDNVSTPNLMWWLQSMCVFT